MSAANRLICVDSNIAGWVFLGMQPEENNTEVLRQYKRSLDLMKELMLAGYQMMIPSVIIAELLCRYDDRERVQKHTEIMKLPLFIPPFTEVTALILSEFLHDRYFKEAKEYKDFTTKTIMKYDSMILACAIEQGAACFYTCDGDFKKYPQSLFPILGIDEQPPGLPAIGMFEEE